MELEIAHYIPHFVAAANQFNTEKPNLDMIAFLKSTYLKKYLSNLTPANRPTYIKCHTQPAFDEEITVEYMEIWEKHSRFLSDSSQSLKATKIYTFLKSCEFKEVLVILGQRFTPGSIATVQGLAPSDDQLLAQAFSPYNSEIKVAVRAWEKHVGRSEDPFWGEISGTPAMREKFVKQLIDHLLNQYTWWNSFIHFKHGLIYEIREENGHGLRWSLEKNTFIGFVEPFLSEQ